MRSCAVRVVGEVPSLAEEVRHYAVECAALEVQPQRSLRLGRELHSPFLTCESTR